MAGNVGVTSLCVKRDISIFMRDIVTVVQPVPKGPRVVPVELRLIYFFYFFFFQIHSGNWFSNGLFS